MPSFLQGIARCLIWAAPRTRPADGAPREETALLGKMRSVNRDFELQTHRVGGPPLVVSRAPPRARAHDRAPRPAPTRARILDAGCGSGRNMVELARRGEVTGVEISPSQRRARPRPPRRRGGRGLGDGDAVRRRTSFDLAVCLDVIEHLPDDRGALRELRRVLAPGGALLVTVPAYQWLWSGHERSTTTAAATPAPRSARPPARPAGSARTHPLQLAAAAGRDRAARAGPPAPRARPNRASTCGCRRRR